MTAVIDTITGRTRDLGGFSVRRVLPIAHRKTIGPFIFLDEMGPVQMPAGQGMDVRPHPHIGLATVTYLFEGRIRHRDSLGSLQDIEPGDVNWMTAGRGIVHSERTRDDDRAAGQRIHGIQSWIALPAADEECAPDFRHHPAATLPAFRLGAAALRLIAGTAYGHRSPVVLRSPLFYLAADFAEAGTLAMPDEHEERAVYIVGGAVRIDGQRYQPGELPVLAPGVPVTLAAEAGTRLMLLGGAALPEPREVWWNFVSSRPARIEQAKQDWQAGRFAAVPGETEFIPLPSS